MNNAWDEIKTALTAAKELNRAVDQNVNTLFDVIDGRWKLVSPHRLAHLKKELQKFDAHKKEWKS